MKKKYCSFSILVLVLVTIASCKKNHNSVPISSEYIEINLDEIKKEDTLLLSQIFNNIDVIQLSDEILIGEISKILIHDEELFILDKLSSAVFIFDKKGNYKKKIGSRGAGPGEMLRAFDMSVDKKNNCIYISDIQTQKIKKYNIKDGIFQSSISLSSNMPMCSYIFYENDTIYLTQFDPSKKDTEYLFRILPVDEEDNNFIIPTLSNKSWDNALTNYNGPFLLKWDNKPLLSHLFMDTIYEYSNNRPTPYIVLSGYEKNFFIPNDLSGLDVNNNPMDMIKILGMNKYFDIHHFMDTDDFIFFRLNKGSKPHNILYDKGNSSAKKIESIYEDLFFNHVNINQLPVNYGIKEDKSVLYYIGPRDWETMITSSNLIKDESLLNGLKNIKDSDSFNGFILCYEIK
ncbi:6-bladed beta-propeller [Proteiniphilum acetatigenes]|uniref:6-bladed beta-propeller n=1 Tax=Proteiniphilum acetatigenes TaxID=294710 RepID=UPI0003A8D9E3|nr:6-bladed beta-propeller [Proteiniphilum acetatigenes]